MISLKNMEDALTYLAESDEEEANLRAAMDGAKKKMESEFTILAAHSGEKTVLEKEAFAYSHDNYKAAESSWLSALSRHGHVKNRRSTGCILIDAWRSLNAARNKGQII